DRIRKEYGSGQAWAKYLLSSGFAHKKMQEIIKAQGGKSDIMSEDLHPGKFTYSVLAKQTKLVKKINSKNASLIAKLLGAPAQKKSGIYLNTKVGEKTSSGEPM